MLKELNCTIIALVPKCANFSSCKDFWPISCCNTIYKCITKILVNRIKGILHTFIRKAQATFVKGRKIRDNILLFQELKHNYHKEMGSHKKYVIKVVLLKAYNIVNWNFLIVVVKSIGFHPTFIWMD